jgi:hypothetical protein
MSDDRPRYAHFFRCRTCGGRFSVVRLTADPARVKTPKCPKRGCLGKIKESHAADIGFDPAEGKAPAQVGSAFARAMDLTNEIVAADHGMTDLNDTMRPGEVTAPKLRPDLQAKADAFFNPPKRERRGRVDLSGLYGERATGGQNGQPAGQRFVQEGGHAIQPILTSKPTGSSPIPAYTDVAPPRTN